MLELPLEFDPNYYRHQHPDIRAMSDGEARAHFEIYGRKEGRMASPLAYRHELIGFVPKGARILEVGPAHKPVFKGPDVRYFDVQDSEGLRQRAVHFNEDPSQTPERIHFLSPDGYLGIVDEKFDYVFSSHSIEHQPDILQHLHDVERVLRPGGLYFVICPDKRYCFDHEIPESTVGEVIEANLLKRNRHRLADIIDQSVSGTHNDSNRHWNGDSPPVALTHERVAAALAQIKAMGGGYVDAHAWRFTSASFKAILAACHTVGLAALRPLRVYDTLKGSNEFCAILGRT